jgi:hypothetical protein
MINPSATRRDHMRDSCIGRRVARFISAAAAGSGDQCDVVKAPVFPANPGHSRCVKWCLARAAPRAH